MLFRSWLPLVALVLLPVLALPGPAEEKQHPPHVSAQIADLEFELRKRELAVQMALLSIKEAEIALERIELQMARAKSDKDGLGVDQAEARIHIEMRKLNQQAAQIDLEQVRARLGRLKTVGESKPAKDVPVPSEQVQGKKIMTLPASKEDAEEVLDMIEKLDGKGKQTAALERLLKQRRDTLREMVAFAETQYRAGVAEQDAMFRASESLIAAELDLATDKAERIALRERRLEIMKRMEEYTGALRDVAGANNADVLAATAERLKAEIELLRERASEN
jgi:hypothetical protein